MELDKKERDLVLKMLEFWKENGTLTSEKVSQLKQSLPSNKSAHQIANYFFIIALACALLSFGALFIDEKFLERFRQYFALSAWMIAVLTGIFSIVWFSYVFKKLHKMRPIFYEMNLTGASVVLLTSLVYVCNEIGFGASYSGFLIVAAAMLFSLQFIFKSSALWVVFLAALMGWYGAFTYAHSHDYLFLGMNYPMRFVAFGCLLSGFAFLQKKFKPLQKTARFTFIAALLIFFTAAWGVSVFGNYNSLEKWALVRQTQVLVYAILLFLAAIVALLIGIKKEDAFLRDSGIVFLLLNLYSRYFEYFWNSMHKGLFFLVIAFSFFILGKWLLRKNRTDIERG